MAKKLPYSHRYQAVRRAVHAITLRDGVAAISLPAVANEVDLSVSSLRRLLPSAEILPRLGLDWVDYRERCRYSVPVERGFTRDEITADATGALAAGNYLLRQVPSTAEQREDVEVRRRLTAAFPHEEWAQDATRTARSHLAAGVDRVVPPTWTAGVRAAEAARLTIVVLGAIDAVCQGIVRPDESAAIVRGHLDRLVAAWLDDRPVEAA